MNNHVIIVFIITAQLADSRWFGRDDPTPPRQETRVVDMTGVVTKYFEEAGGMLTATSECLASAAAVLPDRCAGMTDADYSRFAVALTNCHLSKSARRTYECGPSDSVERCTYHMDSVAFGAYTTIVMQVHSMCQQLQQEMRAVAADKAIATLVSSTSTTAGQLAKLGNSAESIADAISEASRAQTENFAQTAERLDDIGVVAQRGLDALGGVAQSVTEIAASHAQFAEKSLAAIGDIAHTTAEAAAAHERFANTAVGALDGIATTTLATRENLNKLADSHVAMAVAVAGVAASAIEASSRQHELLEQQHQLSAEQRAMSAMHRDIMDTVNKISWFQSAIFGEILDIKSAIWYLGAAVLCFFITATNRTAGARIHTLVGLVATLILERCLVRAILGVISDPRTSVNLCCMLSSAVRMAFVAFAGLVVVWKAVTHRDGNKMLLEELQLNRAISESLASVLGPLLNKQQ
jgi:hypothetical protein